MVVHFTMHFRHFSNMSSECELYFLSCSCSHAACRCPWCWTDSSHLQQTTRTAHTSLKNTAFHGRIWPFNDPPRVFPYDVVLCEDEERPVDGEAVLPVGDGVVQSHGPGPLRLSLFHGSRESRRCRRRRVLRVTAALQVPIPGVHRAGGRLVSKPSHSTKRRGETDGPLQRVLATTGMWSGAERKNDPPSNPLAAFRAPSSHRQKQKSCKFLSLHIHKKKKKKTTNYLIQLPSILRKSHPFIYWRFRRTSCKHSPLPHLFNSALQSALDNF